MKKELRGKSIRRFFQIPFWYYYGWKISNNSTCFSVVTENLAAINGVLFLFFVVLNACGFFSSGRPKGVNMRSSTKKETFDGCRKDVNLAIDRICEFTGEHLCNFLEILENNKCNHILVSPIFCRYESHFLGSEGAIYWQSI